MWADNGPVIHNVQEKHTQLDSIWKVVQAEYKILELVGQGSYGQVCKAQHRLTKKMYAIKLVKNAFKDEYSSK
jgi:serine/threonine protein kinase